jgi:ribosomal protein L37AE/L43A
MKSYGKSIRDRQPTRITLPVDLKVTLNGKEIGNAELKGVGEGTGEERQDGPSAPKEADVDGQKQRGKAEESTTDDQMKCPECGAMIPKSSEECPECGADLFDVAGFMEEEKSGRVFSGENFTAIKGVHGDVRELNKGQHVRDASGIEMCKRCDKRLRKLVKEYDIPIGKSARAISAKNLAELKEIHADLRDIDEGDHVLTDKGRPIATRAARNMGGLVTKYDVAEAEEGKAFSVEEAMAKVITEASPEQRIRIKQVFAAIEQVEQENSKAKQFRLLVGS